MKTKYIIICLLLYFKIYPQKINTSSNETFVETKSYIDYNYGYEIVKPSWLEVRETRNIRLWGGVFPEVNGIENAVYIAGYNKSEFESFDEFKKIYITGNKFGEVTLFSKNHIWYGRNEKDFKTFDNGVSSRVFTIYKDKVYHNQFVLLETSKAFLFINFSSTPETYDENIEKFNEFLSGLILR